MEQVGFTHHGSPCWSRGSYSAGGAGFPPSLLSAALLRLHVVCVHGAGFPGSDALSPSELMELLLNWQSALESPTEPRGLSLKQIWLVELVNILLELVSSLHSGQFSASHPSQGSAECWRGAYPRYQPLSVPSAMLCWGWLSHTAVVSHTAVLSHSAGRDEPFEVRAGAGSSTPVPPSPSANCCSGSPSQQLSCDQG